MLEFDTLNNYLSVVEQGSISAAARKLMIAQPALSRQMQKLEEELGCKLFERGRRIILTDAGRELKESAENLILAERAVRVKMQRYSRGDSHPLRLAMTAHNTFALWDGVIAKFLEKYPEVRFEMYEKSTVESISLLKEGEVELAIVNAIDDDSIKVHCNINDPLVAAWHPEMKVNKSGKTRMTVRDLNGLPLGLIRSLNERISGYCMQEGFSPHIVSVSSQLTTSLLMAKNKKAVAIVPYSAVAGREDLSFAFFKEAYMVFPTNVVSSNALLSKEASNLVEIFKQGVKDFPFSAKNGL